MPLPRALIDTSVIIDGLHTHERSTRRYQEMLRNVAVPVTSSFCRFEYVRKILEQVHLALKTIRRLGTVAEAHDWLVSQTSASPYKRPPNVAIHFVYQAERSIRDLRPMAARDPDVLRKRVIALLIQQARSVSRDFERTTRLTVVDGSGCVYQQMEAVVKHRDVLGPPRIECDPAQVRCRVNEHLRGVDAPGRSAQRKVFDILRVRKDENTATDEHLAMLQSITRARQSTAADHKLCLGAGDLIAFMDAVGIGHAVTLNGKDWLAFHGVAGVIIHVIEHRADAPLPEILRDPTPS